MAEIKPCGSHDGSALGVPTLRLHRQGVRAGLRIQTRAPKTSQEHPYRRQGKFNISLCVVNKSSHVEIMRCLSTVRFLHAIHSKLFKGRSSTAAAAASANARLFHFTQTPIYSFRCSRLPHSYLLFKPNLSRMLPSSSLMIIYDRIQG
jgi:hypothetical protein